jgi:hypothetical protein
VVASTMPLLQSRRHFENARHAINQMRSATSFEGFEAAWRQFLQEINKVWKKVELECKKNPKFNGWHSKYVELRKEDPLLCYVLHARNSDEHTLTEITKRVAGSIGVSAPPETGVLHIRSLKIQGGTIEYDGSPAIFAVTDPSVQLERVFDRGIWYDVPGSHLGQELKQKTPLTVAERALAFYADYVAAAEQKFS